MASDQVMYMRRDGKKIPARLCGRMVGRLGGLMCIIEQINEDGSTQRRRAVSASNVRPLSPEEVTHYRDGSCTPEWLRLMNEMEHEE
jgi:hypothetical protein